jgi:hypothetical protein
LEEEEGTMREGRRDEPRNAVIIAFDAAETVLLSICCQDRCRQWRRLTNEWKRARQEEKTMTKTKTLRGG